MKSKFEVKKIQNLKRNDYKITCFRLGLKPSHSELFRGESGYVMRSNLHLKGFQNV
jgi:hypothetical protein